MAPHVVVTRRLPDALRAELGARFDVTEHDGDLPLPREELLALVAGAEGILAMVSDRVDGELLDAAGPQLRVVANHGVGYDNVDVPEATRRGVLVSNTPDVLTDATAELTLAILLALVRRVAEGDRFLRTGEPWTWTPRWMLATGLSGRTLGIVGLGRIGAAVARLAVAFGMDVVHATRSPRPDAPYRQVPLDELLATVDVVSLHCPLTAETRHLIDADALRRMRRDAFLVNTTRGPVVDEAALVEALRAGEIAGAALDVFEREPEVHPGLRDLPNAVLTPHLGSGTTDTRHAMGMLCVTALEAVLVEDRCPSNAIDPSAFRPAAG
ncbi:MAG: D-glycerate dehydrogenase [Thermoleophilia bacterium]